MTAYAVERDRFIIAMQAEGMAPEIARRILRHANTVRRLAVVSCNGVRSPRHFGIERGEGEAYHGICKADYDSVHFLWSMDWRDVTCPDCLSTRAERLIHEWCDKASDGDGGFMFTPVFGGGPRGACVKLRVPSGRTDDGGREGMCVPTRRY